MSRIIFKYCNPYSNYLIIDYIKESYDSFSKYKSYCHSLEYQNGNTKYNEIASIDQLINIVTIATKTNTTISDTSEFDTQQIDKFKTQLNTRNVSLKINYEAIKLILRIFNLKKSNSLAQEEMNGEINELKCNIESEILKNEKFSSGVFENYSFGSHSLENKTVADTFKSCRFNFVTFKNCDMTNAVFKNCVLHKCIFINCDFEMNTDIKGCKFISCNFDNCNFDYATLRDCDISEMYFKNTNTDKTLFCECEYRYAFLVEKYIEENTEVINIINEYRKDKQLLQTNFFEKLNNYTCDDRKMSQEYIKYCMGKLKLSDVLDLDKILDKTKEKDLKEYLNKLVKDLKETNLLRKGYILNE